MDMRNILMFLFLIYVFTTIYIASWLGVLSVGAFCFIMFVIVRLLKFKSFASIKEEFCKYWGESITALVGSLILPYLIYLKSNYDYQVAILFALMIIPSIFLIGFIWLRAVNKFFEFVRIKILKK